MCAPSQTLRHGGAARRSTRSIRAASRIRTATASATCRASPRSSTMSASLGVDGIWLSPFFTSPMRDFGYDVADYRGVDPVFGTLARFRRAGRARACARPQGHHRPGLFAQLRPARLVPGKPLEPRQSEGRLVRLGRCEAGRLAAEQLAVGVRRPRLDLGRAARPILSAQFPRASSPTSTCTIAAVQDALLDVARFWLDRGVDGFRIDAINFAMHDPQLRDNPPAPSGGKRTRPFDFQQHLYNQSHPDIAAFLERLRELTDSYGERFTVAEVGGEHALKRDEGFTAGETRLNSAYGFDFLYAGSADAAAGRAALPKLGPTMPAGLAELGVREPRRAAGDLALGRGTRASRRDSRTIKMLLLCSLRGNDLPLPGRGARPAAGRCAVRAAAGSRGDRELAADLGRDGARTPMPWRRRLRSSASRRRIHGCRSAKPSSRSRSIGRSKTPHSLLQFTRDCLRAAHAHVRRCATGR